MERVQSWWIRCLVVALLSAMTSCASDVDPTVPPSPRLPAEVNLIVGQSVILPSSILRLELAGTERMIAEHAVVMSVKLEAGCGCRCLVPAGVFFWPCAGGDFLRRFDWPNEHLRLMRFFSQWCDFRV